jgi:hypothetical protein
MLEQKKNEKNPPLTVPHLHPKLFFKKSRHFECVLSLSIGNMKFLCPKLIVTIFGLG